MRYDMQLLALGRPLRFMSGDAKRSLRRFGTLRYSRLGSLRDIADERQAPGGVRFLKTVQNQRPVKRVLAQQIEITPPIEHAGANGQATGVTGGAKFLGVCQGQLAAEQSKRFANNFIRPRLLATRDQVRRVENNLEPG